MSRELDNWIDSYLYYTRHDESPEIFHLWTALTVLSVAVNRNCWMSRAYYNCYPNLYVLFVGPSGVGKSSASGIGVELMRETSVCQNVFRDAITPPALLAFMSLPGSVVTYEIDGKFYMKTPLFIFASELGNLLTQRGSVKELTSLLTELFNKQGDHEDTTNVRGVIKIVKPIVTFMGCCPPKWIEEELPTSTLRSGFLGRMLVARADGKRFHNPEPRFTKEDERLRASLQSDLERISSLYGEMVFDDKTHKEWEGWYKKQPLDLTHLDDEVEGFAARKPQFVQRLSMLLTISKSNERVVRIEEFRRAVEMVEQCQSFNETLAIQDKVSQLCEYVVGIIARHRIRTDRNTISRTELMQLVSRRMNAKMLSEVMDQLVLEGRINTHGNAFKLGAEDKELLRHLSRKGKKVKGVAEELGDSLDKYRAGKPKKDN